MWDLWRSCLIPTYLQTKWEKRWGIRKKVIAYQDFLSFLVVITFLLFLIFGLRKERCAVRDLTLFHFAVYFFSQLISACDARC